MIIYFSHVYLELKLITIILNYDLKLPDYWPQSYVLLYLSLCELSDILLGRRCSELFTGEW